MTVPMATARTTYDTYSAYLWQCLWLQLLRLKTHTLPVYGSAYGYSSYDLRHMHCLSMAMPMATARTT